MPCPSCGTNVKADAKLCAKCGVNLVEAREAQAAQADSQKAAPPTTAKARALDSLKYLKELTPKKRTSPSSSPIPRAGSWASAPRPSRSSP